MILLTNVQSSHKILDKKVLLLSSSMTCSMIPLRLICRDGRTNIHMMAETKHEKWYDEILLDYIFLWLGVKKQNVIDLFGPHIDYVSTKHNLSLPDETEHIYELMNNITWVLSFNITKWHQSHIRLQKVLNSALKVVPDYLLSG